MRQAISSRIEEIAQRVALSEGIEVVEVEVKGGGKNQFVRISIDKPEGVSHADCESISHQVGHHPGRGGRGARSLHAGSQFPGPRAQADQAARFERFQGKKAKVTLRAPVENQRHWEGTLAGFADGVISLEAAGRQIRFPFEQVEKANLKFEW